MSKMIGICNTACQQGAPVKAGSQALDVCMNYFGPVTALVGIMTQDFSATQWLSGDDCSFSDNFQIAMDSSQYLDCSNVQFSEAFRQGDEPPADHNVGMCDDMCQAGAPMTVAGGVMDVNFNYTAPVEVIGGVMSSDFSTVWWLTDSCILSEDFGQAATNSMRFSCTNVAMPAGSEHGWVF